MTNELYIKHPDKIYNVWGAHPDDFSFGDSEEQKVFSMIPHFFYEFNNDPDVKVVYAGLSPGKNGINFFSLNPQKLQQYLLKITKTTTKLCFDNLHEGNVLPMVDKIYQAISGTSIHPSQIYYFSGALDCDEIVEQYYQQKNITEKINVYGCNVWEYGSKKNTEITEIEFEIKPKDKTFLCFNRINRHHRLSLVCLLISRGLIDMGYCSFFPDNDHTGGLNVQIFLNALKYLISPELYSEIETSYKQNEAKFPLKLNIDAHQNINFIQKADLAYFQNSQLSVVTETYFFRYNYTNVEDCQTIFFTEKIFKPILMKHPFILVSRPHSLKWLKEMKYKTFHPFIDESYDDIEDDEQRLLAIVDEIERLNKFTPSQWEEWQKQVHAIVEHNFQVLHNKEKHEYAFTRAVMKKDYKINTDIPGWNGTDILTKIAKFASFVPENGIILELGALFGRSTYALGHNKKPSVKLITIDVWHGIWESNHKEVHYHDQRCSENEVQRIKNLMQDGVLSASDFYGLWKHYTEGIPNLEGIQTHTMMDNTDFPLVDFIFHDAGHDYINVYNDLNHWWPKLKSTGFLIIDDYEPVHFPDLVRAVNQFVIENNLYTEMITDRNLLIRRK